MKLGPSRPCHRWNYYIHVCGLISPSAFALLAVNNWSGFLPDCYLINKFEAVPETHCVNTVVRHIAPMQSSAELSGVALKI
jgi:hypothetical protein